MLVYCSEPGHASNADWHELQFLELVEIYAACCLAGDFVNGARVWRLAWIRETAFRAIRGDL